MQAALIQAFVQKLQSIDATRTRMESLAAANTLSSDEILLAYEALFLRTVVAFEAFLEDLFYNAVAGSCIYPAARCAPMVTFSNSVSQDGILRQGDDYMDWLPLKKTLDRAELYLDGGRPFSELNGGHRSQVQQIVLIRHAIAHAGAHALNTFTAKVVGSAHLLPIERTPSGFLRSQPRQGTTRFEIYLGNLASVATALG